MRPGIIYDATLSDCGTYRFTLGRKWNWRGRRQACFIGLNPSAADDKRDDPTVCRWMHFARAWGYDGFVAVNLYPYRSPSPAECRRWSDWHSRQDWFARDMLQRNLGIMIEEVAKSELAVACWGAGAWDPMHVDQVVDIVIKETGRSLSCFGRSKDGSPMHPMARGRHRISDDAQPVFWRTTS